MVTFLMSTFCVTLSYARQDQKPKVTPNERAAKRIEMMKQSLHLTDEQVEKLQKVQKQLFEDMKQVRGTSEVNREKMKVKREEMKTKREEMKAKMEINREEIKAKRERMKAKMEAYEAQLKTIFTPEQYQQYQEQRKNIRKNPNEKIRKGGRGEHQKRQIEN